MNNLFFKLFFLFFLLFTNNSYSAECQNSEEVCIEHASERVINGIKIYKPCWKYQYKKECNIVPVDDCSIIDLNQCNLVAENCVEYTKEEDKEYCINIQKDYLCSRTETYEVKHTELIIDPDNKQVTKNLLCKILCIDGNCNEVNKANYENNDEFGSSIAQLQMLSEVKNGLVDKDNITFDIFRGDVKSCNKKITSYTNCCSDSGWAKQIGLASCKKEEIKLAEEHNKGKCHYIGQYCSSKEKISGVCLIKKKIYCCYPNVLSKAIQIGARKQLGKTFGSPNNPQCQGLTLQEVETIDFSLIDFSEFYTKEIAPRIRKYSNKDNEILMQNSFPKLKQNQNNGLNKEVLDQERLYK